MNEDKHTEWKESWGEEHLKVICAFANAQGGILEIGKNDKSQLLGLPRANVSKLLEKLPNKINAVLGIIPEIDHIKENTKHGIQIKIKPYKNPISYNGRFYYRSGSTNQELRGNELFDFLLDKMGQSWDGVTIPKASIEDLDSKVLAQFRKLAVESKRLPREILKESNEELIKNQLKLTEDNAIKRAGILLFHPDPEKYVTGAFIKIGYFADDATVLFHDEVRGDLFTQVRETMELLLTKYLKAFISYEGLYRVEKYPVPQSALREALINAVVHRDYGSGAPIQIRVYPHKIVFRNTCRLPAGWTVKDLTSKHQSQSHNPDIAQSFFWANMIESWGRGIIQMKKACLAYGAPEPKIGGSISDIYVEFKNHEADMAKKLAQEEELKKTSKMDLKTKNPKPRKKPLKSRVLKEIKPQKTMKTDLKKTSKMDLKKNQKMDLKKPLKTDLKTNSKPDLLILRLFLLNPSMTILELGTKISKSRTTTKRAIRRLQQLGHLKRVGPDKGGHWEVIEKGRGL